MFTGIVETTGRIVSIEIKPGCHTFCVQPHVPFTHQVIGESIAMNGVCLTLERFDAENFYVTAVPETLRLTNLSELTNGSVVNLERAMFAHTRIGGHYVQGHVDGVGTILDIQPDGAVARLVKIGMPKQLSRYIIKKGFIGLDGMSITIVAVEDDWFTVTFIPHTIDNTIVKEYQVAQLVNIEVDMLAKYVEKLLEARYAS